MASVSLEFESRAPQNILSGIERGLRIGGLFFKVSLAPSKKLAHGRSTCSAWGETRSEPLGSTRAMAHGAGYRKEPAMRTNQHDVAGHSIRTLHRHVSRAWLVSVRK